MQYEHCYFYLAVQRAVFFVDYVEDQDSFVGAKKLTDFYSVIFILAVFFILSSIIICSLCFRFWQVTSCQSC